MAQMLALMIFTVTLFATTIESCYNWNNEEDYREQTKKN